jgi:stringent starvation protein B
MPERSTRPYLIRALHQWALDSGFTPQIAVDVTVPGVQVPHAYVKDGQIVLNIHPQAVQQLELGDNEILFSARFGGKSEPVIIPVHAVLAIYARENGRGIQFQPGEDGGTPPSAPETGASAPAGAPQKKGAHLRRVK